MGEGFLSNCLCPSRIPTASMWGAVGAVGLVWATDWRLILDWVPYINGKFKKDD
ncbi:Cytochrome b-c1 complex subunit 10 [Microtus ochrogaster]|uniref:Cytochrome b-c1 complex subunit 10 n=1 Tax=Microtus ochrogaster TaxID=79684 RepID=A0A8J6GNM0_MICOH|nr:Cytochrome b-c1 complex subunit 10 [Microtus ochrogaster]